MTPAPTTRLALAALLAAAAASFPPARAGDDPAPEQAQPPTQPAGEPASSPPAPLPPADPTDPDASRPAPLGGPTRQAAPSPALDDPLTPPTDPNLEPIIRDLERSALPRPAIRPSSRPSIEPVRPGLPGSTVRDLSPAAGRAVPEGTFLPARRGVVRRAPSGEWVFEPDADAQGIAEAPLVLLPSTNLTAIEEAAARHGPDARLVITGQAFTYHGRSYLLPTAPPMLQRSADGPPPAAAPFDPAEAGDSTSPAPAGAPDIPTAASPDPSVTDIIRGLEGGDDGQRRRLEPVSRREPGQTPGDDAHAAPDPAAEPLPTPRARPAAPGAVAEGSVLTSRRGRLVRSPAGEWTFVVDNAPGAPSEPPMILMPCRNLAAMEAVAERFGEQASFTVSGQVFAYHGRFHLLPTFFRASRTGERLVQTR